LAKADRMIARRNRVSAATRHNAKRPRRARVPWCTLCDGEATGEDSEGKTVVLRTCRGAEHYCLRCLAAFPKLWYLRFKMPLSLRQWEDPEYPEYLGALKSLQRTYPESGWYWRLGTHGRPLTSPVA